MYDLVILQEGIQNSNSECISHCSLYKLAADQCFHLSDNTTRFLLLETTKEGHSMHETVSETDNHWRAIVRMVTSAANNALTVFINKLTVNGTTGLQCHIRSIERRAKKDAVDTADEAEAQDEGHWPFVYLIEVEARAASSSNGHISDEEAAPRATKRAETDDGVVAAPSLDFSQHLSNAITSAQLSDESRSSAVGLGIWPVKQAGL